MSKPSISRALRDLLRLLVVVRTERTNTDRVLVGLQLGRCWGHINAMREAGLITLRESYRLDGLVSNAFDYAGKPFPSEMNGGPVMPAFARLERKRADQEATATPPVVQPVKVSPDESQQIPAPTAPPGLRLLCMLVETRAGETRSLPIHTVHPVPPSNRIHGKWPDGRYACFVLRETHSKPASAEVVARCLRQRQADTFRANPRTLRA